MLKCTGIHGNSIPLGCESGAPPAEWEPVFEELARECNLKMKLREGFETVREFTEALEL